MLDWLFQSDYDYLTTIALWSIVGVFVTTIVLFVYTLGLRVATIAADKRRQRFLNDWRDVFATSILSKKEDDQPPLPPLRIRERIELLEEWNRARSMVDGNAVENLIKLAQHAGIPGMAIGMLGNRRMRSQILAVQTIGHLKLQGLRGYVRELLDHRNTALSITAASALIDIDPDFGVAEILPMINTRRDWPKTRVSVLLRQAGCGRIAEPMYRAIRAESDAGKTFLLQFAKLMDVETLDAMVTDLIRESRDPGVINAALKLVSSYSGVPRIAALTQHGAWFVRMQAAKVLGRVGQIEHLSLLESLLDDPEWWVRYRAAQAITSLPFLGPNQLRQLQRRQSDRFASDILQQCFAEVGIA